MDSKEAITSFFMLLFNEGCYILWFIYGIGYKQVLYNPYFTIHTPRCLVPHLPVKICANVCVKCHLAGKATGENQQKMMRILATNRIKAGDRALVF